MDGGESRQLRVCGVRGCTADGLELTCEVFAPERRTRLFVLMMCYGKRKQGEDQWKRSESLWTGRGGLRVEEKVDK